MLCRLCVYNVWVSVVYWRGLLPALSELIWPVKKKRIKVLTLTVRRCRLQSREFLSLGAGGASLTACGIQHHVSACQSVPATRNGVATGMTYTYVINHLTCPQLLIWRDS